MGFIILALLTHFQLQIGVSTPAFDFPFKSYSWVESIWLKSLWEFLSITNLRTQIELQWTPDCHAPMISFLMELAPHLHIHPKRLSQINNCCLYLQVLTIADLTTANVTRLLPSSLQGERDLSRPSRYHWPIYPPPPRPSFMWMSWRLLLQHISKNTCLFQPLGSWISENHQNWLWFQSHSREVYHIDHITGTWHKYLYLALFPPTGSHIVEANFHMVKV